MKLLNMNNPLLFEYRFKRLPRNWSISEVDNLYQKCKEREIIKRESIIKKLYEIVEKIPKSGDRSSTGYCGVVYSKHGNKYFRRYIYNNKYDGITYGMSEIIEDRESERNYKIDFIADKINFILGQELEYLIRMSSSLSHHVFKHLNEMIYDEICKRERGKGEILDCWGNRGPSRFSHHITFPKLIRINGKTYLYKGRNSELEEVVEEKIINLT